MSVASRRANQAAILADVLEARAPDMYRALRTIRESCMKPFGTDSDALADVMFLASSELTTIAHLAGLDDLHGEPL
jgi:hypothetical protein